MLPAWTTADEIQFMKRLADSDWPSFERVVQLIDKRRWDKGVDRGELHRAAARLMEEETTI